MAIINGTPGDDILNGTANDDTITGFGGNDTLNGLAGNDQLYGGEGTDYLYGGDGDDYLNPGNNTYFDWIDTGAGNDTVDFSDATASTAFYNIANDSLSAGIIATIDVGANTGTIDKGASGITTIVNVANALNLGGFRLIGTQYDDVFNITPGAGGYFQIRDSGGNDTIFIGAGTGKVILDYSRATSGVIANLKTGVIADDGLGGQDTLAGPGFVSDLRGSFTADDILRGNGRDNRLDGRGGDDRLYGRDGTDYLYGGDGDDYLNPGNNTYFDWIDTGAGNDTVDFSDVTASTAFYNIANDSLSAGISATINSAANTGTIDKGASGITTIVNVTNALNLLGLRLIGTQYDDVFNITLGAGGYIQIRDIGGDDTIFIGAGTGQVVLDYSRATSGVIANLKTGVIADDGLGGQDTLTGPGSVSEMRGSMFDDTILGSANDESFVLMAGSDVLNGRGGIDTLRFDRPDVGAGTDVDLGAGTATGIWNGQAFGYTLSNIENVTGTYDMNDTLRGSAQDNRLEGRGGNDRLEGRAGNDTLLGEDGNDRLLGQAGTDRLEGGNGKDKLFGGGGKDRLEGGGGKDKLDGGGGNDRLLGGKGNDTLDGGGGNDRMTGGKGNDTFVFGTGNDVVTDFNAANNNEKIDLSGVGAFTNFNNLKKNFLTETAGNVVIDDEAGNTMTLLGLDTADLNAGDFIF